MIYLPEFICILRLTDCKAGIRDVLAVLGLMQHWIFNYIVLDPSYRQDDKRKRRALNSRVLRLHQRVSFKKTILN